MDSLTHLFVGGAIAAAIAPARHRRAALLAGAALQTLPDLDVLPLMFSDNPIVRMTWHRGPTHSLLVLPGVALALWAWFRSRGGRVADAPRAWFGVFLATLLAHPLLDAFTVYGTQLWWPLPVAPAMWSSLYIIDPLVTLPALLACTIAWFARERLLARRALLCGLVVLCGYLGWSLLAKSIIEDRAQRSLAAIGLHDAPHFSVPQPFTTRAWRVVAMTDDGYVEGQARVFGGDAPIRFRHYPSNHAALAANRELPAVQRMLWFNHGFARAEVADGLLVLSDLRIGSAPDYPFRFAVARRGDARWHAIMPVDLTWQKTRRMLRLLWWRLWAGEGEKPPAGLVGPTGPDTANRFPAARPRPERARGSRATRHRR